MRAFPGPVRYGIRKSRSKTSGGTGFPNKNPCMKSSPIDRTRSNSSSRSTPSRQTFDVHVMTERHHKWMNVASNWLVRMSRTKVLSILTTSAGEFLEHAERRIARAEIIHGYTDAEVSDASEHSPDTGIFTDHAAFVNSTVRFAGTDPAAPTCC